MEKEHYIKLKNELTKEIASLLSLHCKMTAKARIRKIAQLDYQQKGIDIEETKKKFKYYEI